MGRILVGEDLRWGGFEVGRILGGECVDLESVILDRSRRLRGLPLGVSNLELEIGIGRENPGLRVEFEFELHTGG